MKKMAESISQVEKLDQMVWSGKKNLTELFGEEIKC